MSKKSFKDNPALNFITRSPAFQSEPQLIATPEDTPQSSAPMKPLYVETRSRRLQLLMQPSLHQKLAKMARAKGTSLNDFIHEALTEFANK